MTDSINGMPKYWTISNELHEKLLEEAIIKYEYIWKDLAIKEESNE